MSVSSRSNEIRMSFVASAYLRDGFSKFNPGDRHEQVGAVGVGHDRWVVQNLLQDLLHFPSMSGSLAMVDVRHESPGQYAKGILIEAGANPTVRFVSVRDARPVWNGLFYPPSAGALAGSPRPARQ